MSSSVCQGLQSCLEAQQFERRILRLKLTPPPPNSNFSPSPSFATANNTEKPEEKIHERENKKKTQNDNSNNNGDLLGGWGFLQALTNTTNKNDDVYVHPLVKRSSSKLTEKSLEMCTENLGSETGGDAIFSDSSADYSPKSQHSRIRGTFAAVKKTSRHGGELPPPLTSISGSTGVVRVKPHREGGRLVLKAVSVSSTQAYFHAERTDGRLRLHLLRESFQNYDDEVVAATAMQREEEEEEEEVEDECSGDDDDDDADTVYWGEDMDDNNENVVGAIGMENYSKPSRCKESDGHNRNNSKGYIWNLEACWVATS